MPKPYAADEDPFDQFLTALNEGTITAQEYDQWVELGVIFDGDDEEDDEPDRTRLVRTALSSG